MNRWTKKTQVAAALGLFVILTLVCAPLVSKWMAVQTRYTAAPAVDQSTAGLSDTEPLLLELRSATRYAFSGTKRVTGQSGSYHIEFCCTVDGDNYAVQTVRQDHSIRQLYMDGRYMLIDDTDKTIRENVMTIDFPDMYLKEALSGKPIRSSEEILGGTQVNRVELYKNGNVYAFYFNQRGELIRYYYIYDGNEVVLDFSKFVIDGVCDLALEVPSTYARG